MAELPDDESIGTLFSRLIEDVRSFLRAELRVHRARLFSRIDDAKIAIVLLATGLVLAQATVVALLVGLLMILRGPVGPGWATAIVVSGSLIVVAILVKVALGRLGRTTKIEEEIR